VDLNPTHLRTLQEIARCGSFSRAADVLGLSQPAVSLHIRHLEAAVDLPVLERVGKRAFPTPAGEALLEHAARVFGELEAARQAVLRLRGVVGGRVRLGTGATASIHLLPPLLRRLRRRYPDMELAVVTGNAPDHARAVVANELDVAIVTLPVTARHVVVTPFFHDSLVALAPPSPAWQGRRSIGRAELLEQPLILYERGGTIRRVIDGWLRRGRRAPRVTMELGNEEAIKKLVGAGLGLSISSEIAARAEVQAGNLVALRLDPPLSRRLGVVRRRDKPMTPGLAAFLEAVEEFRRTLRQAR
jgi:DNA-binding transcriptional LysR family regulator